MKNDVYDAWLANASKPKATTLTCLEAKDKFERMVSAGFGDRQVFIMRVDEGITIAEPVLDCLASEPYDGDVVWIITPE